MATVMRRAGYCRFKSPKIVETFKKRLFLNAFVHTVKCVIFALYFCIRIIDHGGEELDFMNDTPFIYLFENISGKYFFDVNKNMVVEVNTALYNHLNKWLHYGLNTMQHSVDCATQNAICELQKRGFLSYNRPKEIKHPLTPYVKDYLENNLKRLILQITQNCNMRCQYCSFSGSGVLSRTHQDKSMSQEIAFRAIDFFRAHSYNSDEVEISFYGGEPLLVFSKIKATVDYALKIFGDKKIKFSMTTNGTVFSREMILYLAKRNFILTISVDGPSNYHDTNRRMAFDGSGSFCKIYNNLLKIKNIAPEYYNTIEFNAVIEPDRNLQEIEEFFNSDPVFKYNHVIVNRVNDFLTDQKYEDTEEFIVEKEALLFRSLIEQIVHNNSKFYSKNIDIINSLKYTMRSLEPVPSSVHHEGPCLPGYNRLFVDIRGVFRICEKASELSNHMIIGGLSGGWDYSRINNLLNIGALTRDSCINCWLIRQCRICPTSIDNITALSKELKEKQCLMQKNMFIDKLNDYTIFKKVGII